MRISDWSSDVCSSDLEGAGASFSGHIRLCSMVDRGWVAGAWHWRPDRCVYHVCRQRVVPGGRNPVAAATVALRSYDGMARKKERRTAGKTRAGATLTRAAHVANDQDGKRAGEGKGVTRREDQGGWR